MPEEQIGDNRQLPSAQSVKNVYVEPYIIWENGKPVKKHKLVLAKEDLYEMKLHVATQMYQGVWDPVNECYVPDPRYEGLSKIEVAQHKLMDQAAGGDSHALRQVEDRILGHPKQQVESLQISATLETFLEKVAREEGMVSAIDTSDCIEGEVVGSSSSAIPLSRKPEELDI